MTILFSLIVLGVLLSIADTNNYDRDKVYVPPHVKDGEMIPGEFKDKEETVKPKDDVSPETQDYVR